MEDYEKKHRAFLRAQLAQCAVLLRSNGDFPLEAPGPIAAYGNGVRHTVKGGTGSGEVNSREFINVEQGLARAGFTLTTEDWLEGYDRVLARAREEFFRQLRRQARKAHSLSVLYHMGKVMPEPDYQLPLEGAGDTAIYVLSRICGEGSDREAVPGDLLLTQTELRDITRLQQRYRRFLLVLNTGGPVDLSPLGGVENILLLSQLGDQTGLALGDILLGNQTPSGKLTTTWAAWEDYPSAGDFGGHDDTCYREGIYVGYRYFDTAGVKPLFAFGHGLSYTEFSHKMEEFTICGQQVRITAQVENIGNYPGMETLQLYVSCPGGQLHQPYQQLAAFQKTGLLAPGGSERLELGFSMALLAGYRQGQYVLEAGDYVLRLGCASDRTRPVGIVRLEESLPVRQVKAVLPEPGFAELVLPGKAAQAPENLPVRTLTAEQLRPEQTDYATPFPIDPRVKALSDRELIRLHVGRHSALGLLSIIGNASGTVPGAAGESTTQPPLVMADGPAGLRLSPKYYHTRRGVRLVENYSLPETVLQLLPKPLRRLANSLAGGSSHVPKKAELHYQYCTALPIGTALAQSWNLPLVRQCGQLVGEEMARFGVQLWLAPAMNLHRDVRCGRNFEYYSEDPVLTGYVAAALTQGVQSVPGRGVTLKHFAANNQETNRFGNSSNLSERALRELYVKAFGICIRLARPKAVMSSYNLVLGTHTAEHQGLCRDILRREFGFTGVLMTDWVIGNGLLNSKKDRYPAVNPAKVAAAGGELFMPGSRSNCKAIQKGLKTGLVSRRTLEENATRLLELTDQLTGL